METVPKAGADRIDPKTTEVRATFSKTMQDRAWSWANTSKESSLSITGEPKYMDDKRTCVLPVKLQPGKTYAVWINSQKFRNFKDAAGRSAVPYLLVFKTKG